MFMITLSWSSNDVDFQVNVYELMFVASDIFMRC